MKQGTMSVLFGCHSIIHSLLVILAWRKVYSEWPKLWEVHCIFLHDVGHWGLDYLDNYSMKKMHWEKGAAIAYKFYGSEGWALVQGHTSHSGVPISRLRLPDKYSWLLAPIWWLISNQIFEPKLQRPGKTKRESAFYWKSRVKQFLERQEKGSLHDVYINDNMAENTKEDKCV